jgi:hypothetical protein
MADTAQQEIKLFYCYARADKPLRDELEKHLAWLRRRYQLTTWHDREILPGEDWEQAIDTHLNTAHLILLLFSPDFMASKYCSGKEMQRALERHQEGTCRVVPILLRPTYWEGAPFSHLQLLPYSGTYASNRSSRLSFAGDSQAVHYQMWSMVFPTMIAHLKAINSVLHCILKAH